VNDIQHNFTFKGLQIKFWGVDANKSYEGDYDNHKNHGIDGFFFHWVLVLFWLLNRFSKS